MILAAIDDYITRRCKKDFEFYCEYSLTLDSSIHGNRPFLPYDYQKYTSRLLDKKKKLIVVTPRQMGFTVLTAARCFWEIQTRPNINVVVVVPRRHHVKHFMSVINKWIAKGQYFNTQPPKGHWRTQTGEITCMANNSTLRCLPSDSYAGKGIAIDMLVMLDFAHHLSHSNIGYQGFIAATKPDAKVLIISTPGIPPEKQATLFKNLYCDAKKGRNSFYPYRVVWWARPENTIEEFVNIVDAFGIKQYNHEILATFE